MVRARKLKRRITIQTPTETKDSYGDAVKTWGTYCIRDAEVVPVQGQEYFTAQQIFSEKSMIFRVRYDTVTDAITPKMRVSYDSRLFNIQTVINKDDSNRQIELMTTEPN